MQPPASARHILIIVLALAMGLSPLATATGQDEGTSSNGVQRIAGENRAGTAAGIAAQAPERATEVTIAAAGDFADALAGAYLGQPILLTNKASLPAETLEALALHRPLTVAIVGGNAAISPDVEAQLNDLGYLPRRLSGQTRFQTAAAVAADKGAPIGELNGLRTVLLASGEAFADAMVAGPVSASAGFPILLTRNSSLPTETADALASLDAEQVIIVGGPAAVSADVLNTVQDSGYQVRRVFGESRQQTAAAVAEFGRVELGWQPDEVVLATGADFPDALAAGPYAGARQAPVLLTGGDAAADAVGQLLGCRVLTVTAVGGEAIVSDAQAAAVLDAAGTADGCAFAPETTPAQAVIAVGDRHEVVMDTRGLVVDEAFAQAEDAEVRFTVVPDTNSITVATIQPADADTSATAVGGGLEASVPVGTDGKAVLAITSRTPGLVVVQACVSGDDGEEICQEVAAHFSARYTAPIGDGGAGFLQLLDGRMCAVANLDGAQSVQVTGSGSQTLLDLDTPIGCQEVPSATTAAIDAAPGDFSLVVDGEAVPLEVMGSDYANWSPKPVTPFIPGPATQSNTAFITNIGELTDVTAINFIDYGNRDVLFATGRFGLKSYDVTDPANPTFLDWEEMPDFWENEDMTVDPERKMVVLSRDPRAFGGSTDTGRAGVYLIDATDPEDLTRIVFHELPTGHTASCVKSDRPDGTVAGCDFLWSGGPATGTHQPEEWTGRPIYVTDIRDPLRPFTYPTPLLTEQKDGVTGYAHDVQVDADGLAWVSSDGGIYGFHTFGSHTDPLTGETRQATPAEPVPFAGGTLDGEDDSGGVLHNSYRPVGDESELGADLDASGFAEGDLIYVTDEAFTSGCTSDGLFSIATLEGSYSGAGFVSTPEEPFRLRTVGTWSPITAGEPGPVALCSAHYFDMKDRIIAYSWYGQGTRFIDVSDPTNPIQVGFHRPLLNTSFAPRFRGEHVFVADSLRGIDVIQLTAGAFEAQAARTQVAAPALPGLTAQAVEAAVTGGPVSWGGRTYEADPVYGWSCWLRRE